MESLEETLASVADSARLRLSTDGRPMAGARLLLKRVLFRLLRPVWFQTHRFNAHVLTALQHLARGQRSEESQSATTNAQLEALTLEVGRLSAAVQRLQRQSRETDARKLTVQAHTSPPEN